MYMRYSDCDICQHGFKYGFNYDFDYAFFLWENELDDIYGHLDDILSKIFIFFEQNDKLYDEVFEIFNSHNKDNTSKN